MNVIVQCRDCDYYISKDFKCALVTGYAHNPKDYCLRKGHEFDVPTCENCKYYNEKWSLCRNIDNFVKRNDFCCWGEYRE